MAKTIRHTKKVLKNRNSEKNKSGESEISTDEQDGWRVGGTP